MAAGAVVAGCGHSARSDSGGGRPAVITVGEVGTLPAPHRLDGGPRLVLPLHQPLRLPRAYPENSVLRFSVPVRNDGDRPLRLEQLVSGCVCASAKEGSDPRSSSKEARFLPETPILRPGQRTNIRVEFLPTVDGPGHHTEFFDLQTNDKVATRRGARTPFATQIYYVVDVKPKRG